MSPAGVRGAVLSLNLSLRMTSLGGGAPDLVVSAFDIISPRQLAQAPLEEAALGLLAGEGEGARVGGAGVRGPSQAAEEVGAGGVREVVVGQLAAREEDVDERQAGGRAVAHGHGGGAVQLHHGRR